MLGLLNRKDDAIRFLKAAFGRTFEGGTPATSTAEHPSVQCANPGSHTVTRTKTVTVVCAESFCMPLAAQSSSSATFTTAGNNIQSTDRSDGAPTSAMVANRLKPRRIATAHRHLLPTRAASAAVVGLRPHLLRGLPRPQNHILWERSQQKHA